MEIGIVILILIVILVYVFIQYNSLVKSNNLVKEAFSTMDVYLKNRWDLVPKDMLNMKKRYLVK